MATHASETDGTPLAAVSEDTPLHDAARLMRDHRYSCLPVCRGPIPVGMLTERDITRLQAKVDDKLDSYLARDVMTSRVVTIEKGQDPYAAFSLMRSRGIRHLVVTDGDGQVTGVTTLSDVMHWLDREYLTELTQVREAMTRDVVTIAPRTGLIEAMGLMSERRFSCLPVAENGRPKGILTESDAIRLLAEGRPLSELTAGEVMSSPVHTARPDDYAFETANRMRRLGVRHMVVVDDNGYTAGIVARIDLVQSLMARHVNQELTIRERTRELAELNEELTRSNQQLKNLDQMKSAFLSSVSHELRTPLTSLLGFAKVIRRDFTARFTPLAEDDPKLSRLAERIESNLSILVHEGQRMSRLINDFLDLTKIEAGRIQWNDVTIDVSELIQHAVHAVRGLYAKNPDVELSVELAERLPLVRVDTDRFVQVLVNLLSNAAKFTAKGSVTVSAREHDGCLRVDIADTGRGIPEQEQPKVFDKFHQVQKRREVDDPSGTGLGLSICKEIVEHYGGAISLFSAPRHGTTVTFTLPAAASGLEPSRTPSAPPDANLLKETVDETATAPLVLAVDDNPGVREYLHQLLQDEGFRVKTVADGSKALAAARELSPDIIIMDLMMPGMDGGAAIRRLRESPQTADIPVVVLSAYPRKDEAGGDAALAKPVDENMLVQTVRGLIRGGRIQGKKCILVSNPKSHANMLMISAGRLKYIRPDEIYAGMTERFQGTVYMPGGTGASMDVERLSDVEDVILVIMPEDEC